MGCRSGCYAAGASSLPHADLWAPIQGNQERQARFPATLVLLCPPEACINKAYPQASQQERDAYKAQLQDNKQNRKR